MLELHVLTGRQAGAVFRPSSGRCQIGRAPDVDLRFDDSGVWDHHANLLVRDEEGIFARCNPPALATLNGVPLFEESYLRNGDRLQLGSVTLQFWLRPAVQRTFLLREVLTWVGLGLVCLLQGGAIVWLTR